MKMDCSLNFALRGTLVSYALSQGSTANDRLCNINRGGQSLPFTARVGRDCELRIANCALKRSITGMLLFFIHHLLSFQWV